MLARSYTEMGLEETSKSGPSRAAILLLALGKEGASKILKHLTAEEIRTLRQGAALQEPITPSELDEIVGEFQDAFRVGPNLAGLDVEMNKLLRDALSSDELSLVFQGEEEPSDEHEPVWNDIEQLGAPSIATLISREHPQVAAYVMQKLRAELAASIVASLEPSLRNDVARRMLASSRPPESLSILIEKRFRDSFVASSGGADKKAKHAALADIVNRMNKSQSDDLLLAIESSEPEEATALRKLLFLFEDVVTMSTRGRLILFDSIPTEVVTSALYQASDELKEAVLSALGARSRRMVEAELGRNEPMNAETVTSARRQIAQTALRLSGEGRLDLQEKAAV